MKLIASSLLSPHIFIDPFLFSVVVVGGVVVDVREAIVALTLSRVHGAVPTMLVLLLLLARSRMLHQIMSTR